MRGGMPRKWKPSQLSQELAATVDELASCLRVPHSAAAEFAGGRPQTPPTTMPFSTNAMSDACSSSLDQCLTVFQPRCPPPGLKTGRGILQARP